ncbi:MAG: arsenosugar biosynthesis radical SAM protein ArsS [Mariprofundales bacterium]
MSFPSLLRKKTTTLQVNLGYRCNQHCVHCHVRAGPKRTEMMDDNNIALLVPAMRAMQISTLDLTGGAPELHPQFKTLIKEARENDIHVMNRCNLTVLLEEGQEETAAFFAQQGVEVIASLPCYLAENVDAQRGQGVFAKSITALQMLNKLGYGKSDLMLNLVYNPQGANLPPSQAALEADYHRVLSDKYGIVFDALFTITNMPVQRFASRLQAQGKLDQYMKLLKNNFQADNLEHVMCRSLLSVDWQGKLYDCDFNQQLNMPLYNNNETRRLGVQDLLENITPININVAEHCYACVAGSGSSCGGALAN